MNVIKFSWKLLLGILAVGFGIYIYGAVNRKIDAAKEDLRQKKVDQLVRANCYPMLVTIKEEEEIIVVPNGYGFNFTNTNPVATLVMKVNDEETSHLITSRSKFDLGTNLEWITLSAPRRYNPPGTEAEVLCTFYKLPVKQSPVRF